MYHQRMKARYSILSKTGEREENPKGRHGEDGNTSTNAHEGERRNLREDFLAFLTLLYDYMCFLKKKDMLMAFSVPNVLVPLLSSLPL